jgi:hypothetical protein
MPTFGQAIRAARLGYHWSEKHGCMIRIDAQGPPWQINLCPPDALPKGKGDRHTSGEYRCWWDKPDVLDMIPDLHRVRGVKRPILFHVNDEGERV